MKVIALLGDINTGKSHTINIAYCLLLLNAYTQIPGYFRVLGNPKFEDIFDILTNGVKTIGVIGMGDYIRTAGALDKLLNEMLRLNCDTVICACRNNIKIMAAVSSYPNHIFITKTLSTGRNNDRIVNTIDARALINQV